MSARTALNLTNYSAWIEAEAVTEEWLTIRPYERPNARNGAPDLLLCREGRVLAVWVRPEGERLTQAQRVWAKALVGDAPDPDRTMLTAGSVTAVLATPTLANKRDLRTELAST
jgi:hypothetical protein